MKVKKLECRNFRNLKSCTLHLDDRINVITGNNGQGKTNLLESLYYLSTTRSFRINNDRELICHGEPLAKISCVIEDDEINKQLACVIHDKGKSCFVSNQQVPKTSEFVGNLNAVLFAPSDLEIFTSSPRTRRRLMDVEIGKIDQRYSAELNRYNKLMKERNAALKKEVLNEDFMDVIEQQMVEASLVIVKKRKEFVSFIEAMLQKRYQQMAKEEAKIECKYSGIDEEKDSLISLYKQSRQKDWFLKVTSVGIHRDDLMFWMNEKPLDSVASQGQRRMVVLSLKLAFIDYVISKTKKQPILLLDDVLSELDLLKRKNLFEILPSTIQTIITTTDLNDVLDELPSRPKVWVMENGILSE